MRCGPPPTFDPFVGGGWLFEGTCLAILDRAAGMIVFGMDPLEALYEFMGAWHVGPPSFGARSMVALAR